MNFNEFAMNEILYISIYHRYLTHIGFNSKQCPFFLAFVCTLIDCIYSETRNP